MQSRPDAAILARLDSIATRLDARLDALDARQLLILETMEGILDLLTDEDDGDDGEGEPHPPRDAPRWIV